MGCLITGSSGLLGGALVKRLEPVESELRLLDLAPPETAHAGDHPFHLADAAEEESVAEAARGVDVIYHLAAAQRMKPQFKSWSEQTIYEKNLAGVRSVLAAARRHDVRKVVFVSSSGVYGLPRNMPCGENHPTIPLGAYGRSKLEAEALCLQAARDDQVDVSMLRPMSIFGVGMTGVFTILFEWVRGGLPVYLLGNGRNRLQTVSAPDLAEACVCAAGTPAAGGRIYNIGSDPDSVPTVLETVQALIAHAGSGSPVVRIPSALLRTAARTLAALRLSPIVPEHYLLADANFVLDIAAARADLGWAPRDNGVQTFVKAYDAYIAAGEEGRAELHPLIRLLNRLSPVGSA